MMERLWYLSVYAPRVFDGLAITVFVVGIGMTCWSVWAFWPHRSIKPKTFICTGCRGQVVDGVLQHEPECAVFCTAKVGPI